MKLQFGDSIHIEVPRNWTYLDSNLKNHISTGRDAVLRLAGFGPESGTKVILLAGNAYTKHRTASATLRLSVQWAKTPIQAEMRETLKFSKKSKLRLLALSLRMLDGSWSG